MCGSFTHSTEPRGVLAQRPLCKRASGCTNPASQPVATDRAISRRGSRCVKSVRTCVLTNRVKQSACVRAVLQPPTLATRVRAALSPASSLSSASLSSRRVDSFQMSPAWQWSLTAADQKAGQLPVSPPAACRVGGGAGGKGWTATRGGGVAKGCGRAGWGGRVRAVYNVVWVRGAEGTGHMWQTYVWQGSLCPPPVAVGVPAAAA